MPTFLGVSLLLVMMALPSLGATKGLRQSSSAISYTVKSRKHRRLGKTHISELNHGSEDVLPVVVDSILYASEDESTFSSTYIGDNKTVEHNIIGTTNVRKTDKPTEEGDNIEKENGEHLSRHHDKSQTSSEPNMTRRDSNHKGNAGSKDIVAEDSIYLFSISNPRNAPTTSSVKSSDTKEASDKNDIEFQRTTDEVSSETKSTTVIDTEVHSNGDVTIITNTTIISKYTLDTLVLESQIKTVTEIRNDCKGLETHTSTMHNSIDHYNEHGHLTFTHIPNDLKLVKKLAVGLCLDHAAGSDNHERRESFLHRKEGIL
jgi:hypothetical protein